jgi:hypothetical protein
VLPKMKMKNLTSVNGLRVCEVLGFAKHFGEA